jgi:hypothetical protein
MAGYVPPDDGGLGQLLFMREDSLLAQPFDAQRLEPTGEPTFVAKQVGSFLLSAFFSTSANGTLAYRTGTMISRLRWFDRNGKEIGGVGEPGPYMYTDLGLSPDGTQLATTQVRPKTVAQGIWPPGWGFIKRLRMVVE